MSGEEPACHHQEEGAKRRGGVGEEGEEGVGAPGGTSEEMGLI